MYKVYRSHVNIVDIDHNSLGQNVIIWFVDVTERDFSENQRQWCEYCSTRFGIPGSSCFGRK